MSERSQKAILIASREFAVENRLKSWWCLVSTMFVWFTLLAVALSGLPWALRVCSSIAAAMLLVRMFVIYHDYQHGAILKDSRLARIFMTSFGLVTLNPSSVWNRSHNHHHKHNSKSYGTSIGSFPIMTTTDYAECSSTEKFIYQFTRHPLTILFAYFTVFTWGMCIRPLLHHPRVHIDAAASLCVHLSMLVWLGTTGLDNMFLGLLMPSFLASCFGAYLFYAQHNFPDAKYRARSEWSHVDAALRSSSFIPMNAFMSWVTGNIGYHHIHHLNSRIPFYNLPDAMRAIPELQSPGITLLTWSGIQACFRLKLWCPDSDRLVGFEKVHDRSHTIRDPASLSPA